MTISSTQTRPSVPKEIFESEWDRIFGKKPEQQEQADAPQPE